MRKFRERWQQKLWFEKLVFFIGITCSVSVIILAVLQLLDVWDDAGFVYTPLTALLMLVQAFENRKQQRGLMIFSLITAAFLIFVWLLILFVL